MEYSPHRAEISSNYQQGVSPSSVTGLVGYWPMDPVDKAVIADVSCNHNNVTLSGSGVQLGE